MRKPENIHLLRRYRLIKSGGFALAFYCALNFSSLGAAVIKLPLSATKTVASSTDLVANASIQSPVGNHQGAVLAKATPTAQSLTPIPEISVLFPIIGLVIAIALTQLLRRRRISQRSGSSNGR
jgi:phosphate/sulfate permease